MKKLAFLLMVLFLGLIILILGSRCFGLWVLPTSYADPNSKWTSETSAYDANVNTYASCTKSAYGNNIDFFHLGVADCNKIRWYTTLENKDATCDVNYDGTWYNVFNGTLDTGWNVCEIGSSQTVVGIRFTPQGSGSYYLQEMHFWQPSTAEPTKVTNISPTDNEPNVDIKTLLTWSAGSVLDTDSYNVYIGTDNPPTNIVDGENVSATTYDTETYNPLGLPPSTTYYWRIDAKNDYDVNEGDIWSFTTRATYKTFMLQEGD